MNFDIHDTYKANIGKLAEKIIEINDFIVEKEIEYYIMDENKEKRDYIKATIKTNEK